MDNHISLSCAYFFLLGGLNSCFLYSASCCDDDENGIRYVVFCCVILGNVEVVSPGSVQCCPSTENFDSGVDSLQSPHHYIVWNMNMNTHIFPEFVVSFKISSSADGGMFFFFSFFLCLMYYLFGELWK